MRKRVRRGDSMEKVRSIEVGEVWRTREIWGRKEDWLGEGKRKRGRLDWGREKERREY